MLGRHSFSIFRFGFIALALIAGACAQDIKPIAEEPTNIAEPSSDGLVYCEDTSNCLIDASDYDIWIYLDLESGLISRVPVDPDAEENLDPEEAAAALREAEEKLNWDLAFQRFKVKTNGGISGSGGMEGARLAGENYDALTQAPSVVYSVDAEDSDDFDQDPDYIFLGEPPWFDYDATDHSLSPADALYVLRSVEGNYFKVAFLAYYDEAGTSGFPSFKWAPIDAPDPDAPIEEQEEGGEGTTPGEQGEETPSLEPGYLQVDTTESDATHYINLTTMALISVEDAATSLDWDIAVQGSLLKTNSDSSGSGVAGAQEADSSDWEAQILAPTVGYQGDLEGVNPVLAQWASEEDGKARDILFLLRSAAGEYAKFQVIDFNDGVFTFRMEMLNHAAKTHTTLINSSDGPVYFDFLQGSTTSPADPAESQAWDFAIDSGVLKTNGGTSGSGDGAAGATEASTLEEVVAVADGQGCYVFNVHKCDCAMSYATCEAEGEIWTEQCPCDSTFLLDEISSSDGSSSNPALSDWHEGDDVMSPKSKVFVVRTRHGGYAKFLITSHEAGSFTFDWAFTGTGQNLF